MVLASSDSTSMGSFLSSVLEIAYLSARFIFSERVGVISTFDNLSNVDEAWPPNNGVVSKLIKEFQSPGDAQ